jgi:hypothetical protein
MSDTLAPTPNDGLYSSGHWLINLRTGCCGLYIQTTVWLLQPPILLRGPIAGPILNTARLRERCRLRRTGNYGALAIAVRTTGESVVQNRRRVPGSRGWALECVGSDDTPKNTMLPVAWGPPCTGATSTSKRPSHSLPWRDSVLKTHGEIPDPVEDHGSHRFVLTRAA